MAPPKGHKWYGGGPKPITEDTPLTPAEWKFVATYINAETRNMGKIGKASSMKLRTETGYENHTKRMLLKPNVRKVIEGLMAEQAKKTIADANEVMEYFTSVMRGEVKDQFGLDAPLTERTNAAKELAKRTVDVEQRKQGLADNKIEVKIDWGNNNE